MRVFRQRRNWFRFPGQPLGRARGGCVLFPTCRDGERSFHVKRLVISATSHERRVAILEKARLVEIYIERAKRIRARRQHLQGRVTRVYPACSLHSWISAWTVTPSCTSVTFRKSGRLRSRHGHEPTPAVTHGEPPASSEHIELPGEMLAHAHEAPITESVSEESRGESPQHDVHTTRGRIRTGRAGVDEVQHTSEEERQPDSNESAPQNFAPRYNPTSIVHRPVQSRAPVIAAAVTAVAATEAAIGKTLVAAAAEDVLERRRRR